MLIEWPRTSGDESCMPWIWSKRTCICRLLSKRFSAAAQRPADSQQVETVLKIFGFCGTSALLPLFRTLCTISSLCNRRILIVSMPSLLHKPIQIQVLAPRNKTNSLGQAPCHKHTARCQRRARLVAPKAKLMLMWSELNLKINKNELRKASALLLSIPLVWVSCPVVAKSSSKCKVHGQALAYSVALMALLKQTLVVDRTQFQRKTKKTGRVNCDWKSIVFIQICILLDSEKQVNKQSSRVWGMNYIGFGIHPYHLLQQADTILPHTTPTGHSTWHRFLP